VGRCGGQEVLGSARPVDPRRSTRPRTGRPPGTGRPGASRRFGAPRRPGRPRSLSVLSLFPALAFAACAEGQETEGVPPASARQTPGSGPSEDDPSRALVARLAEDPQRVLAAEATPPVEAALRSIVAELPVDPEAPPPSPEEAAFLQGAAEVARALAYRRRDARPLALAEACLDEAARGGSVPGACAAALARARLALLDRQDPGEAYRLAFVAASRFGDAGEADCLGGLDTLMAVTAAHRPSDQALADALEEAARRLPGEAGPGEAPAPPEGEDEGTGPARLVGVRLLGGPGSSSGFGEAAPGGASAGVRVVLAFDAPPALTVGEVPAADPLPARTYLDVAGGTLSPEVPGAIRVGAGGLARVRLAQRFPDVLRVVFDRLPGSEVRVLRLPGADQIWVDAVRRGGPPGAPRLVVLDPGHGGPHDHGARAGDLREADLALDLARRTADLLEDFPEGFRALLTRTEDVAVELEARTAYANAVGADIFVSVHLNAADEPVQRGGVTTFVLDTTDDRQAIALAARENGTTPGRVTRLQTLIAGLHRADQVAASRRLAAEVQRRLVEAGRAAHPELADRGVKEAGFHVLVGARMPAVLLEASFLTHPPDAEALGQAAHRNALARGLAEAIRAFAAQASE